jgi:hypothetical protein
MTSQKKLTVIKNRLNILEDGDKIALFCKHCRLPIANGYNRVVIGERGPYIEFERENMMLDNMSFVAGQRHIYFDEYSSNCEHKVFIYFQRKTVVYADYLVDKFYIGPDLLVDENGTICIDPESMENQVPLF